MNKNLIFDCLSLISVMLPDSDIFDFYYESDFSKRFYFIKPY